MENETNKKLSDAKSSSYLFIVFGAVGLLLIAAVWLGIIPLRLALYMKILYTLVLGGLFLVFLGVGIYYTRRLKTLQAQSDSEEQKTEEIIRWITASYSLADLDADGSMGEPLSIEQLYFERTEKISQLITEKYQLTDEKYLDYLIEKIYQTYVPSEEIVEP